MTTMLRRIAALGLVCLLTITATACKGDDSADTAATIHEVAAQTREYGGELLAEVGEPERVQEVTAFCMKGDLMDEDRTELHYLTYVEVPETFTLENLEAVHQRFIADGWESEPHAGDVRLTRDGYAIDTRLNTDGTRILVDLYSPCAATPPDDDPLHPDNNTVDID